MRLLPLAVLVGLPLILACSGLGGMMESAQMKRAKDFISVAEYESARQELRVQLHNKPEDRSAKALLVFIQLADRGPYEEAGAVQCLLLGSLSKENVNSTAAEEGIKQAKLDIRKKQLDLGIPTRDWEEYSAVLTEAVTYGWTKHDFSPEETASKLTFAFCAAIQGDQKGITYLVDHLAQDDNRARAQSYLYLVGEPAAEALSQAAASTENLSSAAAGETLRNLRLARRLMKFSSEHKDRVSPLNVRTDGSEGRGGSGGKFLMRLGWRDDNEALRAVLDAAMARESISKFLAIDQAKEKDTAPVMVRLAEIEKNHIALLTVAIPSTQTTETPEGEEPPPLQHAGINTTFLTEALKWGDSDWLPLTIEGKPSVSGTDLALLAVQTMKEDTLLSADQLSFLVYRGLQMRRESSGWYGSR
ncbi:MAG TPA: hypothetical protein PLA94_25765, partial [Myxococcota bacterium]|nr:hypothetical protein [Myxococcota bacterium]